jgi:hypothetical protein
MELTGVTASAYLRRVFVSVVFSALAASSLPAVAQIERQMGAAETVAIAGVNNMADQSKVMTTLVRSIGIEAFRSAVTPGYDGRWSKPPGSCCESRSGTRR